MESLIRLYLTESPEELSLPKGDTSAANVSGAAMSPSDFAPEPSPQQSAGLAAPSTPPNMPTSQPGMSTIQKEVLNKQLVLAVTAELKSVISTYEKRFENEDLTVDEAKIYLNNFLETLAFHADKIAHLIGEEVAPDQAFEEDLGQGVEVPEPVETPEPLASEPITGADEEMSLANMDYTEPAEAPVDEFTDPNGAI